MHYLKFNATIKKSQVEIVSSSSDDASRKRSRRLPLGEKDQRFFCETLTQFLCFNELDMKKWILLLFAIVLAVSCATSVAEEPAIAEEELVAVSEDNAIDASLPLLEAYEIENIPEVASSAVIESMEIEDGSAPEETALPQLEDNATEDVPETPSVSEIQNKETAEEPLEEELPQEAYSVEELPVEVEEAIPAEEITPEYNIIEEIPDNTVITIPEIEDDKTAISRDVILREELSSAALQIMGIMIIVIVLFTASVAIRSANRMPLSRGFSAVISILFSVLPIIISVAVIGRSVYWLLYLILLTTYFIFRTKDRTRSFQ